MKFRMLLIPLLFLVTFNFSGSFASDRALIPLPQKVEWLSGIAILSNDAVIAGKNININLTGYFISQIKSFTGLELKTAGENPSGLQIILSLKKEAAHLNKEAYQLSVTKNIIEISAGYEQGLFLGMQTFFQLIPPATKVSKTGPVEIPCCLISDKPQFSWRGLHIDCCRHFMTKDFIKRYIDLMAYYKFNTFHWRLVEDQGWRIEIKKYPRLTEIGAWRKEADGSIYGGFYTQQDIKEVVAYANERHINIVPEIEMPGHTLSSLAAYPQFSCTGGPFEVAIMWGVMKDIYCAGNDSTFLFLQDVLDEVASLFPGKYIHIGGDEAPKDRWKECPKCQTRIKTEKLKDEHELQGYFTKRIAGYLALKGKTVIGWDEVLQGGLAPGMIVQSWQSFQGATDAAKLGHYTICSPASHTYLNHDPEDLDVRIAYSFKPVPDDLTPDEKKFVLGGEANLWTEHAPQETVDSKLFPRLLSLAEVFWNNPLNKDYDEFYSRVQNSYKDMEALGIEYGRETKAISSTTVYDGSKKEFLVTVTKTQDEIDIRYTTDGKEADINSLQYNGPIKINKTTVVKIAAFKGNRSVGKRIGLTFDFHKALNAKLTLTNKYDERYRAGGENGIIDGITGSDNFRDGTWQGYEGNDFECVIDLKEKLSISEVSPRFILNSNSWIFLPAKVEISLSDNGIDFETPSLITHDIPLKNADIVRKEFTAKYSNKTARYIKIKAENIKVCPDWHPSKGGKAWLFIDEIKVK